MKPLSIFFHVYLSGGTIPANPDNVMRIVREQLSAIKESGLLDACQWFYIGVNGTTAEHIAISALAPENAIVTRNVEGVAELPTMKVMHGYCKSHPGEHILYFHTKGAIHNGAPVYEAWRNCMQSVVIGNWRGCTDALNQGFDMAGAHWLTPQKYGFIGKVPYWGGNFFWATSDYLATLPEIDINADRYAAEIWVGRSPRKPRVRDFKPHFPMSGC